MPNRPDIPESGRIQRDQTSTVKNPGLEWSTDVRRDDRFGANIDANTHPPGQERALHNAIARNVNCRRDNNDAVLPKDPLDDEIKTGNER